MRAPCACLSAALPGQAERPSSLACASLPLSRSGLRPARDAALSFVALCCGHNRSCFMVPCFSLLHHRPWLSLSWEEGRSSCGPWAGAYWMGATQHCLQEGPKGKAFPYSWKSALLIDRFFLVPHVRSSRQLPCSLVVLMRLFWFCFPPYKISPPSSFWISCPRPQSPGRPGTQVTLCWSNQGSSTRKVVRTYQGGDLERGGSSSSTACLGIYCMQRGPWWFRLIHLHVGHNSPRTHRAY